MFEKQQKLDVSVDELAVIQAALHTQAKILSVQASAGGNGARRRLNEVKRALARVSQQIEQSTHTPSRGFLGWFGATRASS